MIEPLLYALLKGVFEFVQRVKGQGNILRGGHGDTFSGQPLAQLAQPRLRVHGVERQAAERTHRVSRAVEDKLCPFHPAGVLYGLRCQASPVQHGRELAGLRQCGAAVFVRA